MRKRKSNAGAQVRKAVAASQTHCATLTELHIVWTHVLRTTADSAEWNQRSAAKYLESMWFFRLPLPEAQRQYGVSGIGVGVWRALCSVVGVSCQTAARFCKWLASH